MTVWSCNTLEVLATLRGLHSTGVVHLDFSLDGSLLVTVGALSGRETDRSPTQLVAVYEWRTSKVVFCAPVGLPALILDCRFVQGHDFVTCGVNHVHFWRTAGAAKQTKKQTNEERNERGGDATSGDGAG